MALEPHEVALVCNNQVTASPELALLYASTRGIPTENIIELSLPRGEAMSAERFDRDVVYPLRKALIERGLRNKIKCIVTFYGVPLKLTPRKNSPAEKDELENLKNSAPEIEKRITEAITSLEEEIKKRDQKFTPQSALDLVHMLRRGEIALARAQKLINEASAASRRDIELEMAVLKNLQVLGGNEAIVNGVRPSRMIPATSPAEGEKPSPAEAWMQLNEQVAKAKTLARTLMEQRDSVGARQQLRELTEANFGLVSLLKLVESQIDYLTPDETTSTDSELALLWYDSYTRKGFLGNPLHYRSSERDTTQVVMVMRLDAPQSGMVRDIFMASKAVEERGGLTGKFAIDSRGLIARRADGKNDAYGLFDERLRELAKLLQRATQLPIALDTNPDVFPPGSVNDVALYCGWYSVRKYVPGMTFQPGAIGYHVASFELVSLRGEEEKGWVRGLLNDGIASTLGAVAEPYLHAFPDPMDFFPLLLTGKYTLAETYWMTLPLVSWKMSLIGDPLYRPFKDNPPLDVRDLPLSLRKFVAPNLEDPEHLPGFHGF